MLRISPWVRVAPMATLLAIATGPFVSTDSMAADSPFHGLFQIDAVADYNSPPPETDATPDVHPDTRFDQDPQFEFASRGRHLTEAVSADVLTRYSDTEQPAASDVRISDEPFDKERIEEVTSEPPKPAGDTMEFFSQIIGFDLKSVPAAHLQPVPRRARSSTSSGGSWVRGFETRFESDSYDSLILGGGVVSLFERPGRVIAARTLVGSTIGNRANVDEQFHFTGDLYAAQRLGDGPSWVKFGWFLDQEEDFGKTGPQFGMLCTLPNCCVMTLDMAYGFQTSEGSGSTTFVVIPDFGPVATTNQVLGAEDFQVRLGTCLCNGLQFGGTLQYLEFDTPLNSDGWEAGGYTGLPIGRGAMLRLDATTGEFGTRGFVSLSWTPGSACCRRNCCVDSFVNAPVNRSVQIRKRPVTLPPAPMFP